MKERIAAWLDDIRLSNENLYSVAERLRAMILDQDRSMTEEIKYGGLLFGAPQIFCGVFVYRAHVSLEFGEGVNLSDPHKVLEGSGKFRRHIKLRDMKDIHSKHVEQMLQQAYAQAATQSTLQ